MTAAIPLVVTIDRSSLQMGPLVLAANRVTPLDVLAYKEPALQPRISYAPTSNYVHGEQALAWAWQQTMLNLEIAARDVASETVSRALVAELVEALTQFAYDVQVKVADAPAETWRCDPATFTPGSGRDYPDLRDHDPVWVISIPCHPVRGL